MMYEDEVYVDIDGYEGKYKLSNYGNVISLNYNNTGKSKLLKWKINKLGFPEIKLSKNNRTKDFMVANLVGKHFLPTKKKNVKIINIDNNKLNCYYKNLKWVFESELRHRMYNNGNRKAISTNTKISYKGKNYKSISKLAEEYGFTGKQIHKRLENGWVLQEAIEIPIEREEHILNKALYSYNGTLMSVKQLSKINNIPEKTIYKRIARNWSVEQAADVPLLRGGNKI